MEFADAKRPAALDALNDGRQRERDETQHRPHVLLTRDRSETRRNFVELPIRDRVALAGRAKKIDVPRQPPPNRAHLPAKHFTVECT